jgi:hypothetical protein
MELALSSHPRAVISKTWVASLALKCRKSTLQLLTHHRILDGIHQANDVGSPTQIFKDFDFTFNLLFLDRL